MRFDSIADYLPPPWVAWIIACTIALLLVVLAFVIYRAIHRAIREAWKAHRAESERATLADVLTWTAAGIATGVSAQGMWRFAGDVLGLDGLWRVVLFAFIEIAVITSAVRARKNVKENYSAGIDGTAVWALTCLTAVLSSLDARSFAEAIFRLAAPLVAAWLWERGMANERLRLTGLRGIHWRVTPERVLVRVGLAETSDRTAGEVDAHRRITRVALAAKRARALEATGAGKGRQRRALTKLDRTVHRAVEHAQLATDPDRMRRMLDQIGAVFSAADLRHLTAAAPWASLDHPAINGPKPSETTRLIEETKQLTAAVLDRHDREASAAFESLLAYAQGRHVDEPGWDQTPPDDFGGDRTRDRALSIAATTGRDRGATAKLDATASRSGDRDHSATTPAHSRPVTTTTPRPVTNQAGATGRNHDHPGTARPVAQPSPTNDSRLVLFQNSGRDHSATAQRPADDRDQGATAATPAPRPDALDDLEKAAEREADEIIAALRDLTSRHLNPAPDTATTTARPRPDTETGRDHTGDRPTQEAAIEHVVATAKATGHAPSSRDLATWSRWSKTTCLKFLNAASDQLTAEGWTLDATGRWTRPVGDPVAAGRINGSAVAAS